MNCPSCQSQNISRSGDYRGQHSPFTGLTREMCNDCSLVFAQPMPDQKALDEFNSRYFFNAHGVTERDFVSESYFRAIANSRINYVQEKVEDLPMKISKVLEIGPGEGQLAIKWLREYPETRYWAVESDADCKKKLEQSGVNFTEISNNMDLVIMSHVLEHVPEPAGFLDCYTKFLAVGGVLFIEVPNEDYKYKHTDEPHLLFFNRKSMEILLQALGFNILCISCFGHDHEEMASGGRMKTLIEKLKLKWLAFKYRTERKSSDLEAIMADIYGINRKSEASGAWLRVLAVKQDKAGEYRQ